MEESATIDNTIDNHTSEPTAQTAVPAAADLFPHKPKNPSANTKEFFVNNLKPSFDESHPELKDLSFETLVQEHMEKLDVATIEAMRKAEQTQFKASMRQWETDFPAEVAAFKTWEANSKLNRQKKPTPTDRASKRSRTTADGYPAEHVRMERAEAKLESVKMAIEHLVVEQKLKDYLLHLCT